MIQITFPAPEATVTKKFDVSGTVDVSKGNVTVNGHATPEGGGPDIPAFSVTHQPTSGDPTFKVRFQLAAAGRYTVVIQIVGDTSRTGSVHVNVS